MEEGEAVVKERVYIEARSILLCSLWVTLLTMFKSFTLLGISAGRKSSIMMYLWQNLD